MNKASAVEAINNILDSKTVLVAPPEDLPELKLGESYREELENARDIILNSEEYVKLGICCEECIYSKGREEYHVRRYKCGNKQSPCYRQETPFEFCCSLAVKA